VNLKQHDLALIEWLDSVQPISHWMLLSDAPVPEIIQCVSVGWVIAETKDVLMLAPNIGDIQSGGTAQASGIIRIPTAAVTRRAWLMEGR
jgi:hypothetical protein